MLLTLVAGRAVVQASLLLRRTGVAVDVAGCHLAEDGEEDWQAEVAAEAPPHATLRDEVREREREGTVMVKHMSNVLA